VDEAEEIVKKLNSDKELCAPRDFFTRCRSEETEKVPREQIFFDHSITTIDCILNH
jgi:hypothetical protein